MERGKSGKWGSEESTCRLLFQETQLWTEGKIKGGSWRRRSRVEDSAVRPLTSAVQHVLLLTLIQLLWASCSLGFYEGDCKIKWAAAIDELPKLSGLPQSSFISHEGQTQLGISAGWSCSPADMHGPKLIPSLPSSTLGFQSCSGKGKGHRELPVGGFCGPGQEVVHVTFAHYVQNSVTWAHLTAKRLEMWCGSVLH